MLLSKVQTQKLLTEYLEKNKSTFSQYNLNVFSPQNENWGIYVQGNPLGAANSFCGLAFKKDIVFFKIWDSSDFIENRVEFIKLIKEKKDLQIEYTDKNVTRKKPLLDFTNWEKLNKSDYCQINSKKYHTAKQVKEILAKIFPLFIEFVSWQRNKNIDGDLLIPVDSKEDLIKNMENAESLLQEKNDYLQYRIIKGHNFVYYKFNGEDRFLPSRYIGYKNITIGTHEDASNKNGGRTDSVIKKLFGEKVPSPVFEDKLRKCIKKIYGKNCSLEKHKHSFWLTDVCLFSENKLTLEQLEEDFDKEVAEIISKRGISPNFRHYGNLKKLKKKESVTRTVLYQVRDPQVVADALRLAKGVCQGCGADKNSLFERASDGLVYLEVHHIDFLSEGGRDTLDNAIALCPTCHRLMHYGKKSDIEKIRRNIDKKMKEREELIKQILEKQQCDW